MVNVMLEIIDHFLRYNVPRKIQSPRFCKNVFNADRTPFNFAVEIWCQNIHAFDGW